MTFSASAGASFGLLALFIVLGLLVYERRGLRLGGVLVLPLLVVYALNDLSALPVFAIAAAVTFAGGEVTHHQTLFYGRRIFVVYLLLGIAATFIAGVALGVQQDSLLMAVLPGLFAFNLHREGRPLRGSALFLAWLGLFILMGAAVLLAAGVETPGVRVLGPPLVAAALAIVQAPLAVLDVVLGPAPLLAESLRLAWGSLAARGPALPLDHAAALLNGLPGAGGVSILGILAELLGGGGE